MEAKVARSFPRSDTFALPYLTTCPLLQSSSPSKNLISIPRPSYIVSYSTHCLRTFNASRARVLPELGKSTLQCTVYNLSYPMRAPCSPTSTAFAQTTEGPQPPRPLQPGMNRKDLSTMTPPHLPASDSTSRLDQIV